MEIDSLQVSSNLLSDLALQSLEVFSGLPDPVLRLRNLRLILIEYGQFYVKAWA